MKILTWNVWYKEDPRNILAFLKSADWDVCCLQEVTQGLHAEPCVDVAEYLMNSLDVVGHFVIAQSFGKGGYCQGNLILSRIPIKNTFSNFIQDFNDDLNPSFSDEGRVVVGVELESSIKILTTHMSYTPRFVETDKKNIESKKLLEYISELSGSFILAGDFNTVSTSGLIKELARKHKNLSPDVTLPTWTTKPFDHEGFQVDSLKYRLDYSFGTNDIRLINTKILDTEYSDHLPIIAEVP